MTTNDSWVLGRTKYGTYLVALPPRRQLILYGSRAKPHAFNIPLPWTVFNVALHPAFASGQVAYIFGCLEKPRGKSMLYTLPLPNVYPTGSSCSQPVTIEPDMSYRMQLATTINDWWNQRNQSDLNTYLKERSTGPIFGTSVTGTPTMLAHLRGWEKLKEEELAAVPWREAATVGTVASNWTIKLFRTPKLLVETD